MVAEVTAPRACSGPYHCHVGNSNLAGIAKDRTDTIFLMAIPAKDNAARCRCGAVARQRRHWRSPCKNSDRGPGNFAETVSNASVDNPIVK